MGPTIRAVFWVTVGGLAGALGSALVGALIGLAFWITGFGFAYDWLDWPIGGAIFGLVVGFLGGIVAGAIVRVGKPRIERAGVLARTATVIAPSAIPGLLLGFGSGLP